MASKILVSLCVVTLLAAASPATAQQDPTGSWASESSGQYFYQGASVTDGTYLYIIGGYQYGVSNVYPWYYGHFRRYDPANNSWADMPNLARSGYSYYAVYGNAGGYYDGNIYSFGGYHFYGSSSSSYSAGYSNVILAFNIADNSWSTLSTSLSTSRYLHAAAFAATPLGDRFYICGGLPGPTTSNEEFNPSSGAVATRAAMSSGLYYFTMAGATVGNTAKVYTMCGYPGPTAACYEYTPPDNDPNTSTDNAWVTRASVQDANGQTQPRYGPVALTLNNRIYLTGGYAGGYSVQTWEYNPVLDLWARRADMSGGRYLHGGATIGGIGYVYGGPPSYTAGEAYTPPDFGLPPNAPTNLAQTGSGPQSSFQAMTNDALEQGWTNDQISFSANVTDPNASQQVRFRVQVKPRTASWTSASQVANLNSGLTAQGPITINYTIPANGEYDWRYRIEDSYTNSHPEPPATTAAGWIEAFGTLASPNTNSPDLRSDQVPPSIPLPRYPTNTDIQMPDPAGGSVTLFWEEATDNGPVSGISYEIQVAREGGFGDIEAQLFSTAGNDQYPVFLSVDRDLKYWRLRARDIGGNFSEWSPSLTFRVTFNDGANHSEGDAKKVCGMGAETEGPSMAAALFGLAILAMATGRRMFRI